MARITTTFNPPLTSDTPAQFDAKAFKFVQDLTPWTSQANALAEDVDSRASAALSAANNAANSARSASGSASSASGSASSAASDAQSASADAQAASSSASAALSDANRAEQVVIGIQDDADRAEDARGYVEAVADAYNVNIKDAYRDKTTLDLNFARGRYLVDDGDLTETTNAGEVLTVERATTKWVEGPNGKLREVPPNTIAREWRNGEPKGALIEERRTNSLTWGEDFTRQAAGEWAVQGSVIGSTDIKSPDGVTNYQFWQEDSQDTRHRITGQSPARFSASAEDGATFSLYVKPNGRNILSFKLESSEDTNRETIYYDFVNGTNTTGSSFGSLFSETIASSESLPDGSYRVSFTWQFTEAVTDWFFSLCMLDRLNQPGITFGDPTYQGDGESGIYIWGAQLEQGGGQPSSYIPTGDAPATREVDNVYRGLGEELNPQAGTVFADFELMNVSSNLSVFYLGLPDNQGYRMNGLVVRYGTLRFAYRATGQHGYESPGLASPEVGRRYRAAFSFDREKRTYACAIDGQTSSGSIEDAAVGDELNTLFLSGRNAHIGAYSSGRNGAAYHDVQYIPYALSESELQEITS